MITGWLGSNWGWAVALFCLVFEISPIKLHPISFVLGWLGRKLTGDIRKDISDLRMDVDMQRVSNIRTLVLDFASSCMNGSRHTKEEFDHVLDENKIYKNLCEKYEIENEVYKESYEYIKRVYRKCLDNHRFLSAPAESDDGDLRGEPNGCTQEEAE